MSGLFDVSRFQPTGVSAIIVAETNSSAVDGAGGKDCGNDRRGSAYYSSGEYRPQGLPPQV
jgi:hypothetical protein